MEKWWLPVIGSGPTTAGIGLISTGAICHWPGQATCRNMVPTEPKLASSLADNGGPTKTIALLKRSPAINAIPKTKNGCATKITTDQRGVSRSQGKGCDIGAFEKRQ